jgi:hypothetical protein
MLHNYPIAPHSLGFFALPAEEQRKHAAWAKATPTPTVLGDLIRVDCDGRMMRWVEYGLNSSQGWHIDHITAQALGGSDELTNLRARHWLGNTKAGGHLGNALRGLGSAPANWLASPNAGLESLPFSMSGRNSLVD